MDLGLLFKEFIWDELVKKAITSLAVKLPFLAWGPVAWFMQPILTMLADKIYDQFHEEVDVGYIPIKNKLLQKNWAESVIQLKLLAHNHGTDSEKFKKERANAKERFSKLINFTTV